MLLIACNQKRLALTLLLLIPRAASLSKPQTTTIEYKQVDGETLLLDVCVPQPHVAQPQAETKESELRPVVIVVHGGGWGSGDRKTMIEPVLKTLTEGGYIYVSIDYRLSPKHRWPACLEDVKDAVTWTKQHIEQYGGDPERMAILGYSAGGQLAFMTALHDQPPQQIKAIVGVAPATDLLEDFGRRGGASKALRDLMNITDDDPLEITLPRLYKASPINHLHADMPPILLLHGSEDRSVSFQQSLHIKHKIEENKWDVPCEVYKLEGAPHRQAEWDNFDEGYKKKLLSWLGEQL